MKRQCMLIVLASAALLWSAPSGQACTGITQRAADGSRIVGRTIEWGGTNLNSRYAIVPRGYEQSSFLPDGGKGMTFKARYGYVGLSVENEAFVAEGINEVGLSAGLFYFPAYGEYSAYDPSKKSETITDLQVVSWILGQCATVDEVEPAIRSVRVVAIDPRASTVHWRFSDPSGRQIVLEIVGGEPHFYENKLGVLTNSPGFEWQLTNLNNYVNLRSGGAAPLQLDSLQLSPFGAGSGFLGLPGDVTPPSRFVRAAFYQATAPVLPTSREAVMQTFRILSSFEIPIGIEFAAGQKPTDIPSATQWTAVTDMTHRLIYYNTMYNNGVRCIDLSTIDFGKVSYQSEPLDTVQQQPVEMITIR